MTQDIWSAVDAYFEAHLLPPDAALSAALTASAEAGLPPHAVAANQGCFLHILARALGARRILEIGALGGYSTIWLARALPADGLLVSLEADGGRARLARANVVRVGLGEVVDIRVGAALDSLPRLAEEGTGPFDLVFIDADKPNNPAYLSWALRLARVGGLIVGDNVVRDGKVTDAASEDANVRGVRGFISALGTEKRLISTALQTVGAKGHDGFTLSFVLGG
ncbi:O-methyltransferase [Oleispirillum naphthae]|uniref:O-methyltransferase n=1 Tax=Oleispirillum naphthae TaxID=2838853 RepID=UPI0030823AF9